VTDVRAELLAKLVVSLVLLVLVAVAGETLGPELVATIIGAAGGYWLREGERAWGRDRRTGSYDPPRDDDPATSP